MDDLDTFSSESDGGEPAVVQGSGVEAPLQPGTPHVSRQLAPDAKPNLAAQMDRDKAGTELEVGFCFRDEIGCLRILWSQMPCTL